MTGTTQGGVDTVARTVELTASYARRAGAQVRLVLVLEEPIDSDQVTLRLVSGRRSVEVATTVHDAAGRPRLEAVVDKARLRGATWRLQIDDGGGRTPVEARLVFRPGQPIALVPGPEPTTALPPPEPREPQAPSRVRRLVGGPAGAVLRRLPADRAAHYRRTLRRLEDRLTR
jgi:hypothetical protein